MWRRVAAVVGAASPSVPEVMPPPGTGIHYIKLLWRAVAVVVAACKSVAEVMPPPGTGPHFVKSVLRIASRGF